MYRRATARSLRRALAIGVGAALIGAVTACSAAVDGRGTQADGGSGGFASGTPGPSTSRSAAAAGPVTDYGAVLEKVALRTADFKAGNTMELIDGGDEVDGEVTLDNCGFTFTTEADRVARRQYALYDSASDDVGLSNELVAYDTPTAASKALAEWHTAAATCPAGAVHSSVAGDPDTVTKVSRNDVNAAGLPITTNGVTIESMTANGETDYETAVLQLDGRYLDILYVDQSDAFTDEDVTSILSIAAITGRRLASSR